LSRDARQSQLDGLGAFGKNCRGKANWEERKHSPAGLVVG
jgi:hypothetical protein